MNNESQLDRDLEALREMSVREIPDLDDTIQTIRRRSAEQDPERLDLRRKIMALFQSIRTRPAVAALAFGALAVLVAMVVPVSYERVVGQDVALTVAGPELGSSEIAGVAQGFKKALGAGSVMVEAISENGAPSFVLRTTVPKHMSADVQRETAEFANSLASKGYAASVQVAPHREKVRYPAVAYAFDQIINISVDGKSSAALEQEIRSRLAQAGVPNAQVSVTDRPEGGRDVRLNMQREQEGNLPVPPEPMPQVVLTKNGAPITGGEGFAVKIQKMKTNGVTSLIVDVTSNGKNAKAEVANPESMSDPALAAAITSQLQKAGIINARVTVAGGKVTVESTK